MTQPVLLSWSGGKDSMMALDALRRDPQVEVVALLTTVAEDSRRLAMHGVRDALIAAQAAALGLPVDFVALPTSPSNEVYERRMADALGRWRERGVTAVAHGDLFLEDIREYREAMLGSTGMTGLFPIWGADSAALVPRFLDRGYRAVVVGVDASRVGREYLGRPLDAALLGDLPEDVDPAGENGEFHSFVHDGPVFDRPVAFRQGEDVDRDGFAYRDLLPA